MPPCDIPLKNVVIIQGFDSHYDGDYFCYGRRTPIELHNAPEWIQQNVVGKDHPLCDDCITEMLRNGEIRFLMGSFRYEMDDLPFDDILCDICNRRSISYKVFKHFPHEDCELSAIHLETNADGPEYFPVYKLKPKVEKPLWFVFQNYVCKDCFQKNSSLFELIPYKESSEYEFSDTEGLA